MAFNVSLDIYEGPLDLLYHIIRRQRLDISEVSLIQIAGQFLETVELMRQIDLDVAADFLHIAALLIELKSRQLLPPSIEEEEPEGDEVKKLLAQLEELQKYKQAAEYLSQLAQSQEKVWFRDQEMPESYEEIEFRPTLYDLLQAIHAIIQRVEEQPDVPLIEPETLSLVDKMNQTLELLTQCPVLPFEELFRHDSTKADVILTFIAMLELIKMQLISFMQRAPFEPITVRRLFKGQPPLIKGFDRAMQLVPMHQESD